MSGPPSLGVLLREIRLRPRPGKLQGLSVAEAVRRMERWGERVTPGFWGQVERGISKVTESKLLVMALAVDATADELRALFHSAGYGHIFDTLAAMGARTGRGMPEAAEAGILADTRLPYEKRAVLIEHLHDILDAMEVRARRVADPGAEPEKPAD